MAFFVLICGVPVGCVCGIRMCDARSNFPASHPRDDMSFVVVMSLRDRRLTRDLVLSVTHSCTFFSVQSAKLPLCQTDMDVFDDTTVWAWYFVCPVSISVVLFVGICPSCPIVISSGWSAVDGCLLDSDTASWSCGLCTPRVIAKFLIGTLYNLFFHFEKYYLMLFFFDLVIVGSFD